MSVTLLLISPYERKAPLLRLLCNERVTMD